MPNYCTNLIRAEKEIIQKNVLSVLINNVDFNIVAPSSDGDDWYEENLKNWSTKWNAIFVYDNVDGDKMEVCFETAWNPPVNWFKKLCSMFPDKEIEMFSDERGCDISCLFVNENGTAHYTELSHNDNPLYYCDDEDYDGEYEENQNNTEIVPDGEVDLNG